MWHKQSWVVAVVLGVLFAGQCGHAFDTGHHWDITYTALSMFGFSPRTIRNMQAMNWMVDFYSVSLIGKVSDFQLMHCDTLRGTNEVINLTKILCYYDIVLNY